MGPDDYYKALHNNADVQFKIGCKAYHDNNYEEAIRWYEQAAENNQAEAQFRLAVMYKYGDGTIENLEKAQYWFEKAAQNGHYQAQKELDNLETPLLVAI